jgi:hypothetical protein
LPDDVELELATVECDYRVHPEAMQRIRRMLLRAHELQRSSPIQGYNVFNGGQGD